MGFPVYQISPNETLTAVIADGKLGYEYKKVVDATYEFRDGEMKEKTKPELVTKLIQGIIPAEHFKSRGDDVLKFFGEQVEAFKGAKKTKG